MTSSIENKAISILKEAYGPRAEFREGQLEAIISVVQKKKTLVVQKTGWGKSVIYFIASKILRQNGAGPTVIVSPLLALMTNQIDAATKLGIRAMTINSNNQDEWEELYADIENYDAIIISPERLANERFMERFSNIGGIQLFVVDEAHSISDWGHDFRPDYQRIVKLLDNFPADIAILGTTATANDRVITDIKSQLGEDLNVVRGDLMRENLAIQINPRQTREERLAWLAQSLQFDESLKTGQGIIYCLTQRDCETVAEFLKKSSISAEAYHAGLGKDEFEVDIAQKRMEAFDKGNLRILVATIKLGMGYDKPDIRFVIHYQLPKNIISYYQQIGRAGRDGQSAYAIMLHGYEDEEILDSFIEGAQASPELLNQIMEMTLSRGMKLTEILAEMNIAYNKLNGAIKYLSVHDHLYKDGSFYKRNPSSTFDSVAERNKQEQLNDVRRREFAQLKQYLTIRSCSMKFLADELDAPDMTESCGICANCTSRDIVPLEIHSQNLEKARAFIKNCHGTIAPRKRWGIGGGIPIDRQMQEGWVLSDDYYSEVGQKVRNGKYDDNHFSDELVSLSKEFIQDKVKVSQIDLVVAVPSLRRPELVPGFAKSLAQALSIPFEDAVQKTNIAKEQKTLLNSMKQQENITQSTTVDQEKVSGKTILLVDDMVDSRWSFTVIADKLMEAGARAVYPFALVKTGSGD